MKFLFLLLLTFTSSCHPVRVDEDQIPVKLRKQDERMRRQAYELESMHYSLFSTALPNA